MFNCFCNFKPYTNICQPPVFCKFTLAHILCRHFAITINYLLEHIKQVDYYYLFNFYFREFYSPNLKTSMHFEKFLSKKSNKICHHVRNIGFVFSVMLKSSILNCRKEECGTNRSSSQNPIFKSQVSSLIHSSRPTDYSPVANIVFTLFCFARVLKVFTYGRTDRQTEGQHVPTQWSLPTVTVGLAE